MSSRRSRSANSPRKGQSNTPPKPRTQVPTYSPVNDKRKRKVVAATEEENDPSYLPEVIRKFQEAKKRKEDEVADVLLTLDRLLQIVTEPSCSVFSAVSVEDARVHFGQDPILFLRWERTRLFKPEKLPPNVRTRIIENLQEYCKAVSTLPLGREAQKVIFLGRFLPDIVALIPEFDLAIEDDIQGLVSGRVEFVISYVGDRSLPKIRVHVTEVKRNDLMKGIAQNMFQIASAYQMNGDVKVPVFGLVTDGVYFGVLEYDPSRPRGDQFRSGIRLHLPLGDDFSSGLAGIDQVTETIFGILNEQKRAVENALRLRQGVPQPAVYS